MRLLFKQRMFSWFDSYDIYDENGETYFTVKGRLSWGHRLEIYDKYDRHIGTVQEKVLSFLPRFDLYIGDRLIGQLTKEFTLFRPSFSLDCNGWLVEGDWFEWDYQVLTADGGLVMQAQKQLFNWTDTYTMDITYEEDSLLCLMIVLAIDAVKCSNN